MAYLPTDDEMAGLAGIGGVNPGLPSVSDDPSLNTPQPTQVASNVPMVVTPRDAPASPPGYDDAVVRSESGGNPNAHTKVAGGTSGGLYGFTDPTFESTIKGHPELAGADKNDPRVLHAFTSDNAVVMGPALGRPPSQVDLIAAHFLGATGAVRFLKSDPQSSVVTAVSPEALRANPQAFFHPDGSPKTVGEVYADAAGKVHADPRMPPPKGGFAPANAQASSTAQSSNSANPFAQQQSDITDFIHGQPGMWAKLQAMQDEYKQKAQPTMWQKLEDAINGFQQQQAAAQANLHASAGGVLNHALPDASSFINALKSTHDLQAAERARDTDFAKTGYEMGASTLQAQNQQALSNLGLTGGMAKDVAGYGVEQRKLAQGDTSLGIEQQKANTEATSVGNTMQIATMKYGQEQVAAFQKSLEDSVPDPSARAAIMQRFLTAGGDPKAPLAANMAKLNSIVTEYMSGTSGTGGNINKPGKQLEVTWYEGGQPQRRVVDENNPADQAWLRNNKPPNANTRDLGATQVTTNTGGGGEGGSGGAGLADQHMQAIQLKQAADTALTLLPYLESHGGTGVLTGTDGNAIANQIRQVTGIDMTGVPVREIYNKLMQQVQTGLVLPSMKLMGSRPAAAEFAVLQKGQLGDSATIPAARAFLNHVSQTADWSQRQIESQSNAAMTAKQNNNPYFDPENSRIQWQKDPANLPPVWHGQDLIDEVERKNTSSGGGGPASRTPPPTPDHPVTTPAGLPAGTMYNLKLKQFRAPDGTMYNQDGSPVLAPMGQDRW